MSRFCCIGNTQDSPCQSGGDPGGFEHPIRTMYCMDPLRRNLIGKPNSADGSARGDQHRGARTALGSTKRWRQGRIGGNRSDCVYVARKDQ